LLALARFMHKRSLNLNGGVGFRVSEMWVPGLPN